MKMNFLCQQYAAGVTINQLGYRLSDINAVYRDASHIDLRA